MRNDGLFEKFLRVYLAQPPYDHPSALGAMCVVGIILVLLTISVLL